MTTKTKTAETGKTPDSRAKDKKSPIPAPVTGPVAPGLNDTREDGAPVVGHFVEVTKGDDKGFFGVLLEVDGDNAVIRNRTDAGVRKSVPLSDVVASSANRR